MNIKTEGEDENKYIKHNPKYPSKNPSMEVRRCKTSIQSSPIADVIYDTETES
jgi:hypothetical protein